MCYDFCCADCETSTRIKCCNGCCLVDCCEWCHEGPCDNCVNCCCCRTDDPNQMWNEPNRCCCGMCWNPCSCWVTPCQNCRYQYCTWQCCCCICDPCACCCGEYKGDIRFLEREIYEHKEMGAPEETEMTR